MTEAECRYCGGRIVHIGNVWMGEAATYCEGRFAPGHQHFPNLTKLGLLDPEAEGPCWYCDAPAEAKGGLVPYRVVKLGGGSFETDCHRGCLPASCLVDAEGVYSRSGHPAGALWRTRDEERADKDADAYEKGLGR